MIGERVELRPYRPDDLEAVFRLDELCFAEEFRFDRDSMRLFAEAPNACTVVAQSASGDIIGFVIAHLKRASEGPQGYVLTVDVAGEHRRTGLASRLMNRMERQMMAVGATSIHLHVFVENRAAIKFYERMNYLCHGRVRGFYGSGVDALIYRKQILSGG